MGKGGRSMVRVWMKVVVNYCIVGPDLFPFAFAITDVLYGRRVSHLLHFWQVYVRAM